MNWQKVGQYFYRTRDLYVFPSSLGRSEVVDAKRVLNAPSSAVAICPFGGPVAVIENSAAAKSRRLFIFTPAYRLIGELDDLSLSPTPVVGVWWSLTPSPELVIVTADGCLVKIPLRPQHLLSVGKKHSIKTSDSAPIIAVSVGRTSQGLPNGQVVALTETVGFFQFDIAGDVAEIVRTEKMAAVAARASITCFSVLGSGKVVAALESGPLVLLSKSGCTVIDSSQNPVTLMALSLTGNFLACYGSSVRILAVTDIEEGVVKPIETSSTIDIGLSPNQLAWIGDDCLSIAFGSRDRNVLFVGGVGGANTWSPYEQDSVIHLSSDLHCAAVLTASKFQIIQRVSPSTAAVFGSNSGSEPEARLVAGYEYFLNNDVRAESTIRSIKAQLEKAVIGCAEAAAFETPFSETDYETQKIISQKILRASIFGRQFVASSVIAAKLFVSSAGLVRACAALNIPEIGIPISVPQLMTLGPSGEGGKLLVNILASRGEYLLARRVAKWLGIGQPSTGHIFNLWAVDLISSSVHLPDRDLCGLITSRMAPGQSLATVAEFALKRAGRKTLATTLVQFESNTEEQVKLLLSLNSEELAIQKALVSADVDLMHTCFDSIIKSQKSIRELITNKSSSLSQTEVALMMSLIQFRYYSESRYEELCQLLQTIPGSELLLADASLELARAKTKSVETATLSKTEDISEWIQYSAERFAECVNAPSVVGQVSNKSPIGCQMTAGLLADSSQLLRAQVTLEKTAVAKGWLKGPHKFIGLSLEETLKKLIIANELGEADTLRTRRKMTEGRWWEIRMQTYMKIRIDDGITFVNKTPPPNQDCRGYKLVVELLLSINREDLALPFIKKLKSKRQVEIYNQLGLIEEARAAQQRTGVVASVPGVGLLGKLASGLMGGNR